MQAEITIIADGDAAPLALLRRLRRNRFTIALDGVAEQARRQRWLPNLIAGDFDTVRRSTLRFFERKGVPLLPMPDQSFTDLEKALAWSVLQGATSIWITQFTGDRIDHTFTALSLLSRYHSPAEREVYLVREKEKVRFLRDERIRTRGRSGRRVAVLPFPGCVASSRGLVYEMRRLNLQLGSKESVSNAAARAEVSLVIDGSALLAEELEPGRIP